MKADKKPLVSVVVPTFNSQMFLEACLNSIRSQTYSKLEVIVVDKKSKDLTVNIARAFGARVFLIDAQERCEQMNYGVKKASGAFVYIVGSDFVLEPLVVADAVEKCLCEDLDAVCIHNTSNPEVGYWARVRKLERDCYIGDELNVAARFFRKEVFEKVGGYNQMLVAAEDYDLQNRLRANGFKIGHIKSKEIHLGEPVSLLEVVRKHYYYGKSMKRFIDANSTKGIKQISPLRPAFIRNRKNFAEQPLLTAGFAIYQITRYLAAGMGFLSVLGDRQSRSVLRYVEQK